MICLIKQGTGSIETLAKGFQETFKDSMYIDIQKVESSGMFSKQQFIEQLQVSNVEKFVCIGMSNSILLADYLASKIEAIKECYYMIAPNSFGLPPNFYKELKEISNICKNINLKILTPSKSSKVILDSFFKQKGDSFEVSVCPHGVIDVLSNVTDEYRSNFDRLLNDNQESIRLLHITSSLMMRKNTKNLLEVINRINQENGKKINLTISVNEHFFHRLKRMIYEINDNKNVVCISNNLEYKDYIRLVLSNHYIIQPSYHEGFGLVPLESIYIGRKAVITDCPGHDEYLEDFKNNIELVKMDKTLISSDDYNDAKVFDTDNENLYQSIKNLLNKKWEKSNIDPNLKIKWKFENISKF